MVPTKCPWLSHLSTQASTDPLLVHACCWRESPKRLNSGGFPEGPADCTLVGRRLAGAACCSHCQSQRSTSQGTGRSSERVNDPGAGPRSFPRLYYGGLCELNWVMQKDASAVRHLHIYIYIFNYTYIIYPYDIVTPSGFSTGELYIRIHHAHIARKDPQRLVESHRFIEFLQCDQLFRVIR